MATLALPTMLWSNLCISICPALHNGLVVMTKMEGFFAIEGECCSRVFLQSLSLSSARDLPKAVLRLISILVVPLSSSPIQKMSDIAGVRPWSAT